MRLLFFLGALAIVGLVVTGAITLQKSDDNTISIQIDRAKVREDAEIVVRRGKAVLQEAGAAIRESKESRQQ